MNDAVRSNGFTALGPMHEAFAKLRGWRAHGVAAILGALGALAFAPFHVSPILVVSYSALIWMIDGARGHRNWGKAVFARGWAFGFGYFLISLHWTAFPFLVEPERFAVFLFMPLILLPAGLGAITGLGTLLAGTFWSASPSRIFMFAVFMALSEWLRGHLFGGFPWNLPGTTWIPGGPLSQAAAIGGVYWLSLMTIMIMSAPAALVDTRDDKTLAIRIMPSLLAVILVGATWAWGAQRLETPTSYFDRNLVLMDVGVPQDEKFEAGATDLILRQYLTLLETYDRQSGDIVIWPEAAIPIPLMQSPNALDAISTYIGDRFLIVGTPRRQVRRRDDTIAAPGSIPAFAEDPNDIVWYNALTVLDASAARSGPVAVYDKHRLVPFGELPAAKIIPFGETLSDILPGALQQVATSGFEAGLGPDNVYADDIPPFTAMICYEGLFPNIPRQARPRADWIVVISNDAWFGIGMGPAQHYAQNRYRSIETGLPMARVASRGVTAVIDANGRELARGEPASSAPEGWKPVIARSRLPLGNIQTLYYRHGEVFFYITLMCLSILAFLVWRR